jgi:hypothetical protein
MTDPDLRTLIARRVQAGLVSCNPVEMPVIGPADPVQLVTPTGVPTDPCGPCGRVGATRRVGTMAVHEACLEIWVKVCQELQGGSELAHG